MEHSSHKSHVADVIAAGVDVIQHEKHLLGWRYIKYLFMDLILSTFTIHVTLGLPSGKLAWCLTSQELL